MHAVCWAHSTRPFVETTKLNQQDVASTRIVAQMAKLFAIGAKARDESVDHFLITLERASVLYLI